MTDNKRTPEEKARRLMELVPTVCHLTALSWFDNNTPTENDLNDYGYANRRRIIDAYLLIKDDLDLSPLYTVMSETNDE